jgi:hypothetical protein
MWFLGILPNSDEVEFFCFMLPVLYLGRKTEQKNPFVSHSYL